MYLKAFILTFLCFAVPLAIFAQKKQNVYFLKNNGKEVNIKDSADFIRVISEPDSGETLFNIKEFYTNGKVKLISKTSKADKKQLEGQAVSFFPNGKRQDVGTYKEGKKEGDFYEYYPNGLLYCVKEYTNDLPPVGGNSVGNLRIRQYLIKSCNDSTGKPLLSDGEGHYIGYYPGFKKVFEEGEVKGGKRQGVWSGNSEKDSLNPFNETYESGKLISGTSTDKEGKLYTYTVREINPEFEGGERAFGRFLSNNIRYPRDAKVNNIQGRVFVTFVIERDGSLTDIKTTKAPSADLADESVRVLKLSPKWIPGYQYGKAVRVEYTVPINFSLAR